MTKEKLEEKIIEYQKQQTQILAQYNALEGAIQALEKLKDEIETEEKEEESDGR